MDENKDAIELLNKILERLDSLSERINKIEKIKLSAFDDLSPALKEALECLLTLYGEKKRK